MSTVLTKVISTNVEEEFRRIKVLRFGKHDVQTPDEASPYGLDSNPVKDMVAVFAESTIKGEPVIVGYLNRNRLAAPGEFRIYSTDANGEQKFYTWLKANGTMEIGGNVDNMVRYSKLEIAFNRLKADHDTLADKHNQLMADYNATVTIFNAHTHPVVGAVPAGPTAPVTSAPITPSTPSSATGPHSTADITPAKINEIKTL